VGKYDQKRKGFRAESAGRGWEKARRIDRRERKGDTQLGIVRRICIRVVLDFWSLK